MLQTEIRRVKLGLAVEDGMNDLNANVQQEAAELLGYRKKENVERAAPSVIQAALAKLEIDVLDWRDVRKYQMERKHETETQVLAKEIAADDPPRWETTVAWNEQEIAEYKGVIPDYVLSKAVQIKRELPEVRLVVEYLSESQDPFLFVTEAGNRWDHKPKFYIEVWDEPKFERGW